MPQYALVIAWEQMIVEEINETLAHLRRAKPDVFGAKNHRFRLNKPRGEDHVGTFQSDARVLLPGRIILYPDVTHPIGHDTLPTQFLG
jgi:hypothetical protein